MLIGSGTALALKLSKDVQPTLSYRPTCPEGAPPGRANDTESEPIARVACVLPTFRAKVFQRNASGAVIGVVFQPPT